MDSSIEITVKLKTDSPENYIQQYIASLPVTLFLLVTGTILGWTSPTIPILNVKNSTLPISIDDEAWIGSLMPLGAVFGTLPAALSADSMGRKKSMLIVVLLLLISWVILAIAQTVNFIFFGRIIAGFALGWGASVQPMYIGEIASPNIRGAMGVIGQIQICLGILIVYSVGPSVSYVTLCLICGSITVVSIMCFPFMPESPYYHVLRNELNEASKVLGKLRNESNETIKEELRLLQLDAEQTLNAKSTWTDLLNQKGNRKAILILFWLMTLQQFNGVNAVLFYSESIFNKTESGLSGSSCTIVIGVIMTISSLIVPYLVETAGRRPLIVYTSLVMGIAHTCLAVYFFLNYLDYDVTAFSYIPLITIMIVIAANSIGIGPIPWVMMSEILSPSIRANGAAFTSATSWFMTFIVTTYFQATENLIGIYGTFLLFAIVCYFGAVVNHIFIPETKGKTLQEIQEILNN